MSTSQIPQPTDLHVLQGQTETITSTYTDESDVAVDLSSYTIARMTVATGYLNNASRTVVFTLTHLDGIDLTNALTGVIVTVMSATRTSLLTDRNYYYDLELEDDSGDVIRLIWGKLYVKPETTD